MLWFSSWTLPDDTQYLLEENTFTQGLYWPWAILKVWLKWKVKTFKIPCVQCEFPEHWPSQWGTIDKCRHKLNPLCCLTVWNSCWHWISDFSYYNSYRMYIIFKVHCTYICLFSVHLCQISLCLLILPGFMWHAVILLHQFWKYNNSYFMYE